MSHRGERGRGIPHVDGIVSHVPTRSGCKDNLCLAPLSFRHVRSDMLPDASIYLRGRRRALVHACARAYSCMPSRCLLLRSSTRTFAIRCIGPRTFVVNDPSLATRYGGH